MLRNLTRETAREHCRTCLLKLDEERVTEAFQSDAVPISQELQQLLDINIMLNRNPDDIEQQWWPRELCPECLELIWNFERFRTRAEECRQRLLEVLKKEEDQNQPYFEVVYEELDRLNHNQESLHSQAILERHQFSEMDRTSDKRCTKCHLKCRTLRKLQKHVCGTIPCPECPFIGKTAQSVVVHRSRVHNISGMLQCSECAYRSTNPRSLRNHKSRVHAQQRQQQQQQQQQQLHDEAGMQAGGIMEDQQQDQQEDSNSSADQPIGVVDTTTTSDSDDDNQPSTSSEALRVNRRCTKCGLRLRYDTRKHICGNKDFKCPTIQCPYMGTNSRTLKVHIARNHMKDIR